MNRSLCLIVIVLLLSGSAAIWAKGASDEDVAAEIAASLDKYGDYLIQGDYEAWGMLHSEDVIKMPPGAFPTRNREDMVAGSRKNGEFVEMKEFIIDVQETTVVDDRAFSWGLYKVKMIPKAGGPEIIVDGKFLTIYRKESDGRWVITHDCFNSNVPPPMP